MFGPLGCLHLLYIIFWFYPVFFDIRNVLYSAVNPYPLFSLNIFLFNFAFVWCDVTSSNVWNLLNIRLETWRTEYSLPIPGTKIPSSFNKLGFVFISVAHIFLSVCEFIYQCCDSIVACYILCYKHDTNWKYQLPVKFEDQSAMAGQVSHFYS